MPLALAQPAAQSSSVIVSVLQGRYVTMVLCFTSATCVKQSTLDIG